jgi:GTP-binding protein
VVLEADPAVLVLDGLAREKTVRAEDGEAGGGGKRHGRNGASRVLRVPVGTVVYRVDEGEREVADLAKAGMSLMVARGGEGGRGNARFATSVRQVPRIAERGLPGERARLRLELRLLADVGLVGLPNAGKSSLLRAMSSARPRVAAYAFTTLEPNVGVVEVGDERMVVADIPGLIERAHAGAGLGVAFLRHVERTAVLVQVVDASGEDPLGDIEIVENELRAFGRGLVEKPRLIALNKIDVEGARGVATALAGALREQGREVRPVSALTGEGVADLVAAAWPFVVESRARKERDAIPVLRPKARPRFDVARRGAAFVVTGEAPERAFLKLGVDSDEARAELGRRLRRMGVGKALERAGAAPGDRVKIGGSELTWPI